MEWGSCPGLLGGSAQQKGSCDPTPLTLLVGSHSYTDIQTHPRVFSPLHPIARLTTAQGPTTAHHLLKPSSHRLPAAAWRPNPQLRVLLEHLQNTSIINSNSQFGISHEQAIQSAEASVFSLVNRNLNSCLVVCDNSRMRLYSKEPGTAHISVCQPSGLSLTLAP